MADRLGVDHQGLQQFVTTSTWDTTAVRMRLARRAVEVVEPVAWVVDDTGFPDGKGSPGVARQYSGTLGKVANCQIGVSVHAVTDTASCPLDWRLFLPTSWDDHAVDEADRPDAVARRAFTPTYSSWLNLVERWFAELTNRKLRRSAHRRMHPRRGRAPAPGGREVPRRPEPGLAYRRAGDGQ
jgi:SRSO17 transposase